MLTYQKEAQTEEEATEIKYFVLGYNELGSKQGLKGSHNYLNVLELLFHKA